MVPTVWSRLLCLVGRRKRLNEWKALLGTSFGQVKDCLLKTGDHVRAIECPLCSCNHEVVPDKDGKGFVAHCRCDDRGCEDIRLTRQMAEAWELSGKTLAETLGRALGVSTGFSVRDGESGLFDLGECPRHHERGHVWLCAGSERMLPDRIADLFQRKGVGCVVAADRASALPSLAMNAGVTIVPVDAAFTFAKGVIQADCQQRCRTRAGKHSDQAGDRYSWVRQAELVRALHGVLSEDESPDKATLTRAVQDGQILSNGESGRKCLLQVDSVKTWLIKKRGMAHAEVQQVVAAMIAEIRMRKQ